MFVGRLIFWSLAATLLVTSRSPADEYQAGTPFTYLFDTGKPAAEPLSPQGLALKTGWTLLAEDETEHRFQGDAVLMNDLIAVVLRARGATAEVYRQTGSGWKRRADVASLPARGYPWLALESLRILENTRGSIGLWETRRIKNDRAVVEYRLATGQAALEVRPGEGAAKIAVLSQARYVVVPDFFGDDMVFASHTLETKPGSPDASELALPAENFFLNLLGDRDAMLMCVWQADRCVDVTASRYGDTLTDCRINCPQGKSLWVALLEGPGLWHEREADSASAGKEIGLDWKPPFAAKWRADFTRPDGLAASWYFTGSGDEGAASSLIRPDCPCRFDADRAIVRLGSHAAGAAEGPIVVYPIDRSRATPLTTFLPIDILRNTLGVGPCQYILQSEGLAGDVNPTPDEVMNWVERELKRKKRAAVGDFQQRLEQMAAHVGRMQARIDKYGQFAAEIETVLSEEARKNDSAACRPVVERLRASLASGPNKSKTAEQIAKLNSEVLASLEKKDTLADTMRLGTEIRRIGGEQERTLANCRMAVRWLRARAAGDIRARADAMLQNK